MLGKYITGFFCVAAILIGCGDGSKAGDPCSIDPVTDKTSLDSIAHCVEITGSLDIKCDELTAISLPALTKVTDLHISSCDQLTEINLPALSEVERDFSITYNPKLTSFDLSALTQFNGEMLHFSQNPALASCLVDAFVEKLFGDDISSGRGDVHLVFKDNNEDCMCEGAVGDLIATCP